MIEALKGTANIAVTGPRSKDRSYEYKRDGKPWQEIHKVQILGCEKAWRFSEPEPCEKPQVDIKSSGDSGGKDYLIGFYDALAMIQTECFMIRYADSKNFPLSDEEMKTLEWLHEYIRNEYEHFMPKIYLSPIQDLTFASELCVRLSRMLLFESENVIFFKVSENGLEKLFLEILKFLS